jgi:hypothetical protein
MTKNAIFAAEVSAIQAPIEELGRHYFSDRELDHLRCLVRLTVEFSHHLQEHEQRRLGTTDLRYLIESIFSGMDSLCVVSAAYRSLTDARPTTLSRDPNWIGILKSEFDSRYSEFLLEASFQKRCRLLIDLFQIQVVFSGLEYD